MPSVIGREKFLLVAVLAAVLAFSTEHQILAAGQIAALCAAVALIAIIVLISTRVAHHAEILAHKVGDPYGTMILTLSAVAVEVLILAILMNDNNSPTLVRDTIYAAVMLDINGILGLAALIGGLRHGEQPYNDNSGKTYGVMILTAMGISMVVPEFVPKERWHYYSCSCACRSVRTAISSPTAIRTSPRPAAAHRHTRSMAPRRARSPSSSSALR